jgi:hypothetical protein
MLLPAGAVNKLRSVLLVGCFEQQQAPRAAL